MNRPPRLAELLMRVLLPRAPFEAIAGDLEEAFHAGTLSRASYCRLALLSIAHYHVDRLRPESREPVSPANERRRGDGSMRSLLQDLGYGFRLLRRSPGFALAAVVTLALGIGANTAIFSLVNVLLLKPLPYRDPSRVAFVLAWDLERHENRFNMSIADVLDIDRRSQTLADVAVYSYWSANLTGGDLPERAQGYLVTGNTFNLLGVQPRARPDSWPRGRRAPDLVTRSSLPMGSGSGVSAATAPSSAVRCRWTANGGPSSA